MTMQLLSHVTKTLIKLEPDSVDQDFYILGPGKRFSTTNAILSFLSLTTKLLKNSPYEFHKILHSLSTPKVAFACAKASKSTTGM